MLVSLLREGQQEADALKADAVRTLVRHQQGARAVSEEVLEKVNGGAAQLYRGETSLDTHVRRLESSVRAYTTRTEQWTTMLWKLNSELKELGDVENWISAIDKDLTEAMGTMDEMLDRTTSKSDNPARS